MRTLITGGIRSGKSRYALELARKSESGKKSFIATAEAFDDDMSDRILKHQQERESEFQTIEEPLRLAAAIRKAQAHPLILIDCLTLWTNNLLFHFSSGTQALKDEKSAFFKAIEESKSSLIFVSNEVGLGLVAGDSLGREYVDLLGKLNQQVAALCDEVIFMVSGIPMKIKGETYAKLDR
jgi:adenosylcobinamide kinase / adenosylcobinamide-phosphate guanylyltransferase